MQNIIAIYKNALQQAEAGLEMAVIRLSKDGKDRGDFKPCEVLALEHVRAALAEAAPAAVAVPDEREAFEKWVENPRLWSLAHQGAQWAAWQARAALAATPAAPVAQLDMDRVLSIADVHADESREDGVRLIDRGGLVAFASDVLRVATPAAVDVVRYPTEADPATETLLVLNNSDKLIETPPAAPVVLPEPVSDEQIKAVFLANGFTIKEGLTDLKPYVYQAARALLATGGQAQAVEQAPVLYVSKGQLDNHRDPDGPDSANAGRYLPCRITPAGKFTTPLFAAPQAQADARDAGLGTARAFIEWVKAQPEDREQTTIDGALVEFEAHIAAIAAAKGE